MLYTSPLLQPIGFVYRRPLPFHLHKIIALPTVRRHPGPRRFLYHTVLRSVITLTTLPNPAISTHFSCQLNNTLIAWPPPSPPPRECTCEKPVGCGDMVRKEAEVDCEEWDMPLYLVGLGREVSQEEGGGRVWRGERLTGISSRHLALRCHLRNYIFGRALVTCLIVLWIGGSRRR